VKKTFLGIATIATTFLFATPVFATTTSWTNPGTCPANSDSSIGTVSWSTLDICANDGQVGYVSNLNGTTYYAYATNFGFAIPTGDQIDGIEVSADQWRDSGANCKDATVKLFKAGTAVGNNLGGNALIATTDDTPQTYGGATNLWGTTWNESDIENAGFGVGISFASTGGSTYCRIDHIKIRVTHSTPEVCGDGNIAGAEECDDNGTTVGDGCSATCTIETGYECTGEPSTCEYTADQTMTLNDPPNYTDVMAIVGIGLAFIIFFVPLIIKIL